MHTQMSEFKCAIALLVHIGAPAQTVCVMSDRNTGLKEKRSLRLLLHSLDFMSMDWSV